MPRTRTTSTYGRGANTIAGVVIDARDVAGLVRHGNARGTPAGIPSLNF